MTNRFLILLAGLVLLTSTAQVAAQPAAAVAGRKSGLSDRAVYAGIGVAVGILALILLKNDNDNGHAHAHTH